MAPNWAETANLTVIEGMEYCFHFVGFCAAAVNHTGGSLPVLLRRRPTPAGWHIFAKSGPGHEVSPIRQNWHPNSVGCPGSFHASQPSLSVIHQDSSSTCGQPPCCEAYFIPVFAGDSDLSSINQGLNNKAN